MYQRLIKLGSFLFSMRNYLFSKFVKKIGYKNIPIVINNRNRLTFLIQLITYLETAGYTNIIILDNLSTYKPLLEYYKKTKHKVIMLNENLGYNALEKTHLYKKLRKNFFVYTDSDVVPIENCPHDFLQYFLNVFKKYPMVQKVGFSLKIDDLPEYYAEKYKVINWEKQFFNSQIEPNLFLAPIDTTFALHRPYALLSKRGIFKMIRTGYPYTAYHMPWYNDSLNLNEEELYYINSVEIGTHWSKGLEINDYRFVKRTILRLFRRI